MLSEFYNPAFGTECSTCDDLLLKKDRAREWLKSVVDQLYSSKPLNPLKLENDLDELCYYLDVKLLPGEMQVQRTIVHQQPETNNWLKLYQ